MLPTIRWHFCLQFIKHYLSATRIDVLHSPFVFSLYNLCIKRQKQNTYAEADALVKQLKQNHTLIEQLDFGKASPETKKITVAQLARLHAKPRRVVTILANIIRELQCKNCIELGTSLGISACYQGLSLKHVASLPGENKQLITIEGSPELAALANKNIEQLQLNDCVQCITGNFDEALPNVLQKFEQIDYAFIDGNHRYEPTLNYFNQLLPKTHNNSVLIFDDIYWSKGMTKAWEEIKQHPQVTVTVDLFFIGLVFFRKEQAKEHFKLRVL